MAVRKNKRSAHKPPSRGVKRSKTPAYNTSVTAEDETPPLIEYDARASKTSWFSPIESLQSRIEGTWRDLASRVEHAAPAIVASTSASVDLETTSEYGRKVSRSADAQYEGMERLYQELLEKCQVKEEDVTAKPFDRDLAGATRALAEAQRALHHTLHHRATCPDEAASRHQSDLPQERSSAIMRELQTVGRWREIVRRLPALKHEGGSRSDDTPLDSIGMKAWNLAVLVDMTLSKDEPHDDDPRLTSVEVLARARYSNLRPLPESAPKLDCMLQEPCGNLLDILSPACSLISLSVAIPPQRLLTTIADRCESFAGKVAQTLEGNTAELKRRSALLGSVELPPTWENLNSAIDLASAASLADQCHHHAWKIVSSFWTEYTRKLYSEIAKASDAVKEMSVRADVEHDAALGEINQVLRDRGQQNGGRRTRRSKDTHLTLSVAQSRRDQAASKQILVKLITERFEVLSAESSTMRHARAARRHLTSHGFTPPARSTSPLRSVSPIGFSSPDSSTPPGKRWVYYTPPVEEMSDENGSDSQQTGNDSQNETIAPGPTRQRWLKNISSLDTKPENAEDLTDNQGVKAIIREIVSLRFGVASSSV